MDCRRPVMEDTDDVREISARQVAERRHLWLRKTRVSPDAGDYVLVDMSSNHVVEGPCTSLERVETWLKAMPPG